MNYIVIDLEWNQSPQGKEGEVKNLPFEIIEIGAVKLDEGRNKLETFREIIFPHVYKEIHFRTKEIIHIDMKELKHGDSFQNVIRRFFQWCGKDYYFCTWGPSDLTELQRNMEYYHINCYINSVLPYYDVQKLFSLNYEGKKNPRALESAVDYLKLEKKQEFHNALSDAEYTAKIFQVLNSAVIREYYSIDYYNNPKEKKDEVNIIYPTYSKSISMEFESKEQLFEDKDIRSTVCYLCGRKAAKRIRWFSSNSKSYYCLAFCREHGFLKGKIRIKKTADGKIFSVKILKLVSENEAAKIKINNVAAAKKN